MIEITSLPVAGYEDRPVNNTFVQQSAETAHLAIVVPGYRHSVDKPDLHFAAQVLLARGADVLQVEYAYSRTDFRARTEAEQDRWLSTDVSAACEAGLTQRSYNRITLVGKSLGTVAMGQLLADPRFQKATCIWSTPILALDWLRTRIAEVKPPSLFIIGTADAFYNPTQLAELETATGGRSLVLEGVDHSLGIPGDIAGSLDALTRIVAAIQDFIV